MPSCAICGKVLAVITASHLSKHVVSVARYREVHGGPLVSETWLAKRRGVDVALLHAAGLGQKPDSVVAATVGVTRRTVTHIRKRLGIHAFVGLVLTQEGLPCRSIYEATYDAWLHWRGKAHKHNPAVCGTPYFADFFVEERYVEIVGMLAYSRYAAKVRQKHAAYDRLGVACDWITPGSLAYICRDCPVPLKFRYECSCRECGVKTRRLPGGLCGACARRDWGRRNAAEAYCLGCGKMFMCPAGRGQAKFCGRACYWESMRVVLPPWEAVEELLRETPVIEAARQLGVSASLLYQRMARRKTVRATADEAVADV